MSKIAYLTIDDGPSVNTRSYVDYLVSKSIPAIMFFLGRNVEKNMESAVYAVKKGILVGNHSYSHPHFSAISFDDAVIEIQRMESLIRLVYKNAGCDRPDKVFRFPYGDKGGDNKQKIQEYLEREQFKKFDSTGISYRWYYDHQHDIDRDFYWTFDYEDYKLSNNKYGWSEEAIIKHMNDPAPVSGGSLLNYSSEELIITHDLPDSNIRWNDYFTRMIDKSLEMGVIFKQCELIF